MTHERIDARSLEFGRAIAERLVADPSLLDRARQNIQRWEMTSSPSTASALKEWSLAISSSLGDVLRLLTDTNERAIRLRQSNPFAGVLTDEQRLAIIKKYQSHDTKSA